MSLLPFGSPPAKDGYIPELTADPVSPKQQRAWVLKTASGGGGSGGGTYKFPGGFGAPILTANTGGSVTYQLSYYTIEGTIKRVSLT